MKKFWKWEKSDKLKIPDIADEMPGEKESERTLFLCGVIAEESWFDDEVTPKLFKDELTSGIGNITVWINSPGGDCIAAAQIYNMLSEYEGKVTVKIDGMAASAASVIAMAGDEIVMSPVSNIMIHNPSTVVYGDCSDFQRAIGMLNAIKESIINAYEIKTRLPRIKLSHLMDSEKWMDAKEAVELGFADKIKAYQTANDNIKYTLSDVYNVQTTANKILYNKIYNKYGRENTAVHQAEIPIVNEHPINDNIRYLCYIKKFI